MLQARFTFLEPLEPRTLASVSALSGFEGMDYEDTFSGAVPPDTHAAAGTSHIVEVVNTTFRATDKAGSELVTRELSTFFGLKLRADVFDPKVLYDEAAGRFIVETLLLKGRKSFVLLAVSNTPDPTGSWELHRIKVTERGFGEKLFGDFPGLAYDADGIYVTMNMFGVRSDFFDHVSILSINKALATDGDPKTFQAFQVRLLDADFTIQPAVMHGGAPGDPIYLVQDLGDGETLQILKMTDKLSTSPTIQRFDIAVPDFSADGPTPAPQSGGGELDTGDNGLLNAAWRNNLLATTHNVSDTPGGDTHARWYLFDTSTLTPTLQQSGEINPGAGVFTFFPSIEIAPDASIGMTYMQSSASQLMSMFITGRAASDLTGTMQTSFQAKAGQANYDAYDGSPFRAGDYSAVSVDPVDGTFWAANEFATSAITPDGDNANWSTWIQNFQITPVI